MRRLLFSLLAGGFLLCTASARADDGSFLYQPAYELDDELRGPAATYCPQPGDIYFSTTCCWVAILGHRAAWCGPPHHSGIVFAKPDGSMGILEAGPFNTIWVRAMDLDFALNKHTERDEKSWIRRRRTPLTPEQSECLTKWAMAQDGKRFAVFRILGQITIFRSRGPLRTYFMGGPHGERSSYFCSELVMESLVHIGLVNPEDTRPAATYPRDLFFDDSVNPFMKEHQNLSAGWYPPARWCSRVEGQ
jgi:hypothetical protein